MGAPTADGIALTVLGIGIFAPALLGRRRVGRICRPLVRAAEALQSRHRPPRIVNRPIELIARDVQRLGHHFRDLPAGVSFARFEGRRRAYDTVLAEACRALEVEHLLAVLAPGSELDDERVRVQRVLGRAGLPVDDVA